MSELLEIHGRTYRRRPRPTEDASEDVYDRVVDGRVIGTVRVVVRVEGAGARIHFEFRGEVPRVDAEAFATSARHVLEALGGAGFQVELREQPPVGRN